MCLPPHAANAGSSGHLGQPEVSGITKMTNTVPRVAAATNIGIWLPGRRVYVPHAMEDFELRREAMYKSLRIAAIDKIRPQRPKKVERD